MSDELRVETVLTGLCRLGEGPIYHPESGHLTFVDCVEPPNPVLYRLDTATNKLEQHNFHDREIVTTALPTNKKDTFVLTAGRDVIEFNWDGKTNEMRVLGSIEQDFTIASRINDAKVDRNGRVYFGSMNTDWDEEKMNVVHEGMGSLYSGEFAGGYKIRKHAAVSPIDLSNGIDWSPDNSVMYFADSGPRVIYAYNYDAQTGELSNERVAVSFRNVKIRIFMGVPDGLAVDANGNIWVACYGAGWVACFDPVTGELIDRIGIPCGGVTSCVFGGPHMNQMYVTSATRQWENGGNLYRVDGFQTKGLPPNRAILG